MIIGVPKKLGVMSIVTRSSLNPVLVRECSVRWDEIGAVTTVDVSCTRYKKRLCVKD